MLDKKYISAIRDRIHAYAVTRRDIIKQSDDALHHAKRAVFAMHRGDKIEAEDRLNKAGAIVKNINTTYKKDRRALNEGAYRAALEEFVEASAFYQFVTKGNISQIKVVPIEDDIYLAGLCDVPGELYRYAIRAATHKQFDLVKECAEMANLIIGELMEFDLTSYLRTKFDQAKQAAHKLEQVVYEVSLRRNSEGG